MYPFKTLNTPTLVFAFFLAFFACKTGAKKDQPNTAIRDNTKTNMPINPLPGPADYAADWKIVDSLQAQGLPKSAAEKVQSILVRARNDKNITQSIKCMLYLGKYTNTLEEDGFVKTIQSFEAAEKAATQPEKAIWQSIIGQCYATYLEQNRWLLQDRTQGATPAKPGEGLGQRLLTASASEIEQAALDYYAASVGQEALLRSISLTDIGELVIKGVTDSINGQHLHSNVWDLLAARALEHYGNERSFITQPTYAFVLDQSAAFAPAREFVNARFDSRDTTSGKWLTIKLYQRLLAATDPAKNLGAYIDYDLRRLRFAYDNSVSPDKDELYQKVLDALFEQHKNHPMAGEILYRKWSVYVWSIESSNAANGERNKQALKALEEVIRQHPQTVGAQQCQSLLRHLRNKTLTAVVEDVSLPNRHLLASIIYRNINRVYVRVVKGSFKFDFWENVPYEQKWEKLLFQPQMQARSWDFQDPNDCLEHRTEINLEALPVGNYWLLMCENADFDKSKGHASMVEFSVSQIAIATYNEKGQTHFVAADRMSGTPLPNVKLLCYTQRWHSSKYNHELIGTSTTDKDGFAKAEIPQNQYAQVMAILGNDTLMAGNASNNRYREYNERLPQIHYFTDRAIYRPGQMVYFKGIAYVYDDKRRPEILANENFTVKFYDANGQEKGSLKLRSNEFGTFNGTFSAPATGLTGQMSIRAENTGGSAYFNVEEYKRPKFEVTLKPINGEYRAGDKITATGEAKNYAGNAVDGAQVRYRVVRNARYPFWDNGWWRKPWRSSPEQEVASGLTTTDATGLFSITFDAVPDRSIPKKDQPVFDYQVMVDVTDINGETRSGSRGVSAGYVALQVDWEVQNEIELDSLKQIFVKTTNWSGEKAAAAGEISLQKIIQPKQNYLNRYWAKPDLHVMAKAEFEKLFPNYAWKDEDNPEKWDRQDFVKTIAFNTGNSENVDLHGGQASPGYYLMRLSTKDKFGEKIDIQRIVRVVDSKQPATKYTQPTLYFDRKRYEPGETARIELACKEGPQHFFFGIEREGRLETRRWLVADALQYVPIGITEDDRGGINVHAFAIRNNRFYNQSGETIFVPWSNKDLNISFETFRDKLQPGEQEEWRIKISGPKKEKVSAEMVAALYDASLDQFAPHSWGSIGFPSTYSQCGLNANHFGTNYGQHLYPENRDSQGGMDRSYPQLNWFDFWSYAYYGRLDTVVTFDPETYEEKIQVVRSDATGRPMPSPAGGMLRTMKKEEADGAALELATANTVATQATPPTGNAAPAPPAPIRRNLQETVFFFPEMRTDKDGNVVLKFKMNEALTRWKLLAFAHSKELQTALATKEVVTQKELMILANAPRFFRAGDNISFAAKVSNLSDKNITGKATLNLLDASTLQPLEASFGLTARTANFNTAAGQSAPLSWKIKIPETFTGAITWQIFAEGNNYRDGEESTLPVVTNRMLVTESLPMTLRGNQNKSFVFDNLRTANSNTLSTHRMTLEFTSNPVWYAVQALPYLMEYPHECSEQMFSRYYANTLASSVTQKMPQIKRVFDRWASGKDGTALASNLAKNQELKYALLEETPWVMAAQSEEQQKKNIALLFDLNRMANEQERAMSILSERQGDDGGFAWFPGAQPSWYITQYIYSGLGHLARLKAIELEKDEKASAMLQKCANFCAAQVTKAYHDLERDVKAGRAKFEDDNLYDLVIQYCYARTLVQGAEGQLDDNILNYYLGQAEKYWLRKGLYQEGLLALALHRSGRNAAAQKIIASLKERAINHEELGMYWPMDHGYFWYQMPIETQALMIEVFHDVANDALAVENLRIWLLKNKQTNRWESTKATSEAVYALLLDGGNAPEKNWLNNNKPVQVAIGGKTLKPTEYEPGTGYFKQNWGGNEVKPSWANIKVENPNSNIVWGAAYWQYFEDLDKIKDFQKTPLTIVKQLFKVENSPNGPVLKLISDTDVLKRGDKVNVRIEIRVDREMEFVHLKDMRAAGFEPINVLSGYRWQGGLGYYESTKDLATHFFMDYLPKGTFVFEYPLVVSHSGDMSNGITTMQCMYAPEFTSHSKGMRVRVE